MRIHVFINKRRFFYCGSLPKLYLVLDPDCKIIQHKPTLLQLQQIQALLEVVQLLVLPLSLCPHKQNGTIQRRALGLVLSPTTGLTDLFDMSKLPFDTLHPRVQHKGHLLGLLLALFADRFLFRLAATSNDAVRVGEVLRDCAALLWVITR